ncbi:DUF1801 domain-containing protein [Sulfitobacter aestuariivivens]|uniref:DUF1801 domain-containing protein n=1 Tax=Sulfitobacter aestuariivivens TaxID=2766981 RepID=A0A927D449_9RHOB|nr:DUF1801 domain-containing protein [Sulfitobacter aestuariivivens]MBD3663524.1 DUF1801 domain-containing protein [Sulfitobacter aestuariivivens]
MINTPNPFRSRIADWPEPARTAFDQLRQIFLECADAVQVGPPEESLKRGQPAWRPLKPRTGSTARIDWHADAADLLSLYVDCKTDLAVRMRALYPDLPVNDGQRHLAIDLHAPVPTQAISHLAEMAFTYHLAKKQ